MKGLQDNRVASIRHWLHEALVNVTTEREAENTTAILFEHIHGWSKAERILHEQDRLSESQILLWNTIRKRLVKGEPVQYIVGKTWFYGLELKVGPAVLIPRPETEELVHEVIKRIHVPSPRILDVGTGSGCIAIALKKNIPGSYVVACDISEKARALAKRNATNLDADVHFVMSDILQEVPAGGPFDVVVSNPPYITRSEAVHMPTSVVSFEPEQALFVDDKDPLLFYRRLAFLLPELLVPGGLIAVECHEEHAQEVAELFAESGPAQVIRDMQGKERMVFAHTKL